MSAIEEIKSRLDIVQYIQQYVPLRKQGRYFKAPCPFHSENTPSFVVYEDRQSWRCFGACAEGGDIFKFAQKFHGWSFKEALEELGKRAGVEVRQQTPEQRAKGEQNDRLRALVKHAVELYHETLLNPAVPGADAALDYAHGKRGLSDATIARFQVGFAPDDWHFLHHQFTALGYSEDDLLAVGLLKRNDKGAVYDSFRARLMIPIRDDRGRPVGFGARALKPDDNPKYLNSSQTPLFDKSKLLFGLDAAKDAIRSDGAVVIVEGYMDAITAHQAGYANVVAQMGTALTETQLRLLVPNLARRVIMALDSDAAGQNATRRSLEVARTVLSADYASKLQADLRVLRIPDAKDPDDLIRENPEAWRGLIEAAVPVAEFVIDMELAALPASPSIQEREAAARRLLPLLLATEDKLYQDANVQLLARRLKLDERRLLGWAADVVAVERASLKQQAFKAPPPPPPADADGLGEPPELPPLDFNDAAAPDFDDEGDPLPRLTRPLRPEVPDVPAERFCLKLLFTEPYQLYDVNRKLRELADGDDTLATWVLAELRSDDFTRDTYRALLSLLLEAMAQNDNPPIEHLNDNLPDALYNEARRIMADEWDVVRPQLRALSADLPDVLAMRGAADGPDAMRTALIEQALRLRAAALQRERAEMSYIKPEDGFDETEVSAYIARSLRATALIDAELSRKSRTARS